MKKSIIFLSALLIIIINGLDAQITSSMFGSIEGRQIGPAKMSGRITSIDAVKKAPSTVWVGAAGGGVWKSINQGVTFKSVFDDYSQSIGCITIDQDHPDTVWVGTGEVWVRNSVSIGTGIYRTTNGGDKWTMMGLPNSERIAKIIIDPADPNTVYVAVLGSLWKDSGERGFYKTNDGGKSWKKTLYSNPSSGCADIVMDPENHLVLYASLWDFRRQAYTFRSGGPGSGLYKSADGGETWNRIQTGLPDKTLGRIALAVSPVKPHWLYALVESEKSALFRSSDKGQTWEKRSEQTMAGERPFYFSLLVADPVEPERIYKPGMMVWVSNNGGKVFQVSSVSGGAYHSDTHALWVNPNDNKMMYLGTDGGVYISYDKGNAWNFILNLPVSQFYHVSVDNQRPYNIYGGLQDNESWMGPSRHAGGIKNSDWKAIGGGDGFYAYCDPKDPNVVYSQSQGGYIYRQNMRTGEARLVKPFPDEPGKVLRFNWNTPTVFGRKSGWLYIGSQYLFRSKDQAASFERISPDLTTNDPERQLQEKSGGLTIDNSTAENNTTIFTVAESPLDENVIWAGTDDGNVQVTSDGGKTWTKMNPVIGGLPPMSVISYIEPEVKNRNGAFVTADAHQNGDFKAYIFYTSDLGKTWKQIAADSVRSWCHVIRQDPVNTDLLFLGTELGLYVSLDHGKNWSRFKNKVPLTGIYDMAFQAEQNDLVLASHGRGVIILDDLTPLRNLTIQIMDKDFSFLPVRPFYFISEFSPQEFTSDAEFTGPNPSGSARVCYYLRKRHIFGDMYIELYGTDGKFLKKLPAGPRKGINVVSIPTSLDPPRVPKSPNLLGDFMTGPDYEPGTYTVKMVKGSETYTTKLVLNSPKGLSYPDDDRKLQRSTVMKAYHMIDRLAVVDQKILDTRDSLKGVIAAARDEKLKKLQEIVAACDSLHEKISATQAGEGAITGQMRLREYIGEVYSAVSGYLGRPTNLQLKALDLYDKRISELSAKIDSLGKQLKSIK
ncbi:MAG TPA: hypothetical protein VMT63_04615 [Bacteroidales bacterium]|nr:hypothetical protein [Bacteroidales bacterium]